jgi:hypothetical protein
MKADWKLTINRSNTGEERSRDYTLKLGNVKIMIMDCHRDYPKEWIMHCYDLGMNTIPLNAVDLDDAKEIALNMALDKCIEKFGKFENQAREIVYGK